ncbi:hypothetical protein FQN55_000585 [Onygenales sp. PD_40]|nr:hypothetical protein FQN55_000585 [Onygenales sp. PD_40]
MNQAQRDAVFAGEFPADLSGEAIRLKTRLPEFHNLRDAFRYNQSKTAPVVNVYFNAKFSQTSIHRKNSPVHQIILTEALAQLKNRLRSPGRFGFISGSSIETHLPVPDFYIGYRDKGPGREPRPIFALEVGFSEPRASLEKCVKDLLTTKTRYVNAAVLVDVKETPSYQNPLPKPVNQKFCDDILQKDPEALLAEETYLEDPSDMQSPLFRFGVRWVGRMRGSAQVWTRDPESQKPIPGEQVIFFGPDAQPNPRLRLKLSDFVPSDAEEFKEEFAFDCTDWADGIDFARWELARQRSKVAVNSLREASGKK